MATPAQHHDKSEEILAELEGLQKLIDEATDDGTFVGASTAEYAAWRSSSESVKYLSKTIVNMIALAQIHATLATTASASDVEESHWAPNRWWRVVAPDGSLWCETSDEDEARKSMRPFDRLMREYRNTGVEWREIS